MELTEQATEKGLQADRVQLENLSGQKLGQIGQPIIWPCDLVVTHLGGDLPAGSSTCSHSLLRIGSGRIGRRWYPICFCQPAEQGMGIEQKLRTGAVAHGKGSTCQWASPAAPDESKASLQWAEPMGREMGTAQPSCQRSSGADSSPVRAPESPSMQQGGNAQAVASPVRAAGSKYRARAFGQKRPGPVAAAGRPVDHPDLPTPALFELLEA